MLNTKKIPYLSQFTSGIIWTLIDSLGSQGLVILYHIFYRAFTTSHEHGVTSCLLSTLYLGIALTNIGLDKALAPFLETFTASRYRLGLFFLIFVVPQVLLLTFLAGSMSFNFALVKKLIPLFSALGPTLTPTIIGLFFITFIFESIRKTLRAFLQLSFYFRYAALVELLGISLNLGFLLALHYSNVLSLQTTWQVLAYSSLAQLLFLAVGMLDIYRRLPKQAEKISSLNLFTRVTKTRLSAWAVQCLNQIYSGNFLVPLCALHFGVASASLMKVITSISYWITLLAKKVFGVTSNALLAHIKSRSPETQKTAFSFLTEVFNQALYGMLIFLLINGRKIATEFFALEATITWSLLYFMLLLTFVESFFVLYERWYILEEDTLTYLLFNAASIGVLYTVVKTLHSPVAILATCIGIRLVTFIALSVFSFYRWQIWPSFKPHGKTIIAALVVACIGYILL